MLETVSSCAKRRDTSNRRGLLARRRTATIPHTDSETASAKGTDHWSVEVFLPYAAFPDVVNPQNGQTQWAVNFARHRVADTGRTWRKAKKKPAEGSESEYQRLHTTAIEFMTLSKLNFAK